MKINYGINFDDYVNIDSNVTTREFIEDNVHDEVESEELFEDDIPTISVSIALEFLRTVSLYYSHIALKIQSLITLVLLKVIWMRSL